MPLTRGARDVDLPLSIGLLTPPVPWESRRSVRRGVNPFTSFWLNFPDCLFTLLFVVLFVQVNHSTIVRFNLVLVLK